VNIVLILQLLLGVTLAFTGVNIFRSMPPLGGFILAGLVGLLIGEVAIPASSFTGWMPYLVFVGSGLVGALLAIPLQIVIVVLAGSALGAVFGFIIGFVFQNQGFPGMILSGSFTVGGITNLQVWLMLILAMVFGVLSIQFEDFMFFASTGFIGSFVSTAAIAGLGAGSYALLRNSLFLFFLFITLGLLATIIQNYFTD
jgi:hypothetical protein